MKSIRMARLDLLTIVRENKQKHISLFNESVNDYKTLVLKISLENKVLAESGQLSEFKKLKLYPTPPVSYESSYAKAIRMLELCIDEIVEISEDEFNQFVLDEWHWKNMFVSSNALYKSSQFTR